MRGVERAPKLGDDADDLRWRWPRATLGQIAQPLLQRRSWQQLLDHIDRAVVLAQVIDLHDIRMAQLGNQPRLLEKAIDKARLRCDSHRQDLDGDEALQVW